MYKYIITVVLILISISTAIGQDFWSPVNGPFGGSVIDIDSHPNGTVYAARYDDIFMSTNDGASWSKLPIQSFASVATIEVSPSGVLYAGKISGGIWWTGNNGASWNFNSIQVTPHSGLWASVSTIKINPSGHIFINTRRSLNGGSSFSDIFAGMNFYANDFEFSGNKIYTAGNRGIFLSTNGGTLWTSISATLPDTSTVRVAKNSNGDVFAATYNTGIYFSSNEGQTWTQRNTGLTNVNITDVEIDASGRIIAATKGGVFISSNNGLTWQVLSGLENIYAQNIHIKNDGKIFIGTQSHGIFRSIDGGQTFAEVNNRLRMHNIWDMEFSAGKIYTASSSGLFFSPNNGIDWEHRSDGIDQRLITTLEKGTAGHLFAGTINDGIYKTTNDGITWTPSSSGLPAGSRISKIIRMQNDDLMAFKEAVGSDTMKLYKSTDNGSHWIQAGSFGEFILSPGFGVDNQGNIYFSGLTMFLEGILYRSTNGGVSYDTLNAGPNNRFDNFAVHGDKLYSVSQNKFFISTDMGETWNQTPGIWGNNTLGEMGISPDGDIFLSSSEGIIRSTNSGQSWEIINSGYEESSLKGFAFNESGFAYIYTYDNGIFVSNVTTSFLQTGNDIPDRFNLSQNYPNPFNPVTQISFDLPQNSNVRLTVYDVSGREVARLLNGALKTGSYTYSFDGSGYSSGVYFYRFEAGSFVETKKMILVK